MGGSTWAGTPGTRYTPHEQCMLGDTGATRGDTHPCLVVNDFDVKKSLSSNLAIVLNELVKAGPSMWK